MSKISVVYIVGPTAAGKTSLAIKVAKQCNGEVISADSRQVYRGLDIGTSKVTQAEMSDIPHHLIDVVDIDTIYTAEDFLQAADSTIVEIHARGNVPIVAGGTFFYVELLRRRMSPAPVPPNPTLRAELEAYTNDELFLQLQKKDSRRANSIDRDNRRRLMRALEIIDALGVVPPAKAKESPYHEIMIGIDCPKEQLLTKFENRATDWLQAGLVGEVESLLANGVTRNRLQEIGFEYQLVLDLIDNKLTKEQYIEKFVQKNWQYAKRQRTWLKKDPSITWFTPQQTSEAIDHAIKQLAK